MTTHGLTDFEQVLKLHARRIPATETFPQTFGRLGPVNPVTGMGFDARKLVEVFTGILDEMCDDKDGHSQIEAGMTFFGQFIDHDITMDATSMIGSVIEPSAVRNIRTPALELDNVYGDGPDASPHLYSAHHKGYLLFGTQDNPLDLARNDDGTALIGDPRNDENIIVSQLQGMFICLHNILLDQMKGDSAMMKRAFDGIGAAAVDGMSKPIMPFEAARRVVRQHYQWLVLNDFLPAFVDRNVLENTLDGFAADVPPRPFTALTPLIPVEFSVAAFRFGHATVQSGYELRDGVRKGLFDDGFRGFAARHHDANIDLKHFFHVPGKQTAQCARPVGLKIAHAVFNLPFVADPIRFEGGEIDLATARKLPHRNVFRDRLSFSVASGQQMARLMGFPELAAPAALTDHGVTKTPLWYYCLQEAERHGGKLGPVGGTIVASVLIRLLLADRTSILNIPGFTPWKEIFGDNKPTLGGLAQFVEANRGTISVAPDLMNPRAPRKMPK